MTGVHIKKECNGMKPFMDEDFLLKNELAKVLFHDYAKAMPIIDYHCHLSPAEIYYNRSYNNITEVWLHGDHYKWRAMRAMGIEELYITGEADDYDKFCAWAKTVPQLIGNPLYHWTHLELQRFFNTHEILNEHTAPIIWEKANQQLIEGQLKVRNLIEMSNVEVICTTDDPIDDLHFHNELMKDQTFDVSVRPSFRPDKALAIDTEHFLPWLEQLSNITKTKITTFQDLLHGLVKRMDYFHRHGCRLSDHGLDQFNNVLATEQEASRVFDKALVQEQIAKAEADQFKSYLLTFLAMHYKQRGWAMQLHINALRNNNNRMLDKLGPDTGYDAINDHLIAKPLVSFFDRLEKDGQLPKTIVYSLNPNDLPILATAIGSFQGEGIAGKMQLGTAWWFNDTKQGMLSQMEALANVGVLGNFIGMLTDSRSFLSFPRHEYFRRIMCQMIAQWVEDGEYPAEKEQLGGIVRNICYNNAKRYFQF